jgi:hypothetical protein
VAELARERVLARDRDWYLRELRGRGGLATDETPRTVREN